MSEIGIKQDIVTLTVGDAFADVSEQYEIETGCFSQPCAFSLTLGNSDALIGLIGKCPPNSLFSLNVDGKVQFTGRTDGFVAQGGSGGSKLSVRGRDNMARLVDGYIRSERSFTDTTYVELVRAGLDDVMQGEPYKLVFSNDANRKAVTGAPKETASHSAERLGTTQVFTFENVKLGSPTYGGADGTGRIGVTEVSTLVKIDLGTADATQSDTAKLAYKALGIDGGTVFTEGNQGDESVATANQGGQKRIQAKIGERWYDGVIKPQLDRAGLFLWCGADGTFILSAPDPKQTATYRIVRHRNAPVTETQVVSYSLRNETTRRYSTVEVHMRRGGGAETRSKGLHIIQDGEMKALGYDRPMCIKDDKCKSLAQAEFLARRKLCESRRNGWSLEYTLSGHTTLGIDGTRVVWAKDTMVEVVDEELGIDATLYIESVRMSRSPQTETVIRLMRPADLIFGELE